MPLKKGHQKQAPDRLTYVLVILCFCVFLITGILPARFSDAVTLIPAPAPTAAPHIRTPEPTATPVVTPVPTAAPASGGERVLSAAARGAPAPSAASSAPETPLPFSYVLNTSTKRFHLPSCKSVGQIREKNLGAYTGPREELLDMGYIPCGNCHP